MRLRSVPEYTSIQTKFATKMTSLVGKPSQSVFLFIRPGNSLRVILFSNAYSKMF